jgi:hypothetical protein
MNSMPWHRKFCIQPVAVIGFVADQALWCSPSNEALRQSLLHKGDFIWASTALCGGREEDSEASATTMSCVPLPRLVGPTALPLFLATMKVPSMKHSERSICPRSCRSSGQSLQHQAQSPVPGPLAGNADDRSDREENARASPSSRAPLRKIHRMPFKTSRLLRHGRPRPSARRGNSGSIASSKTHCSSLDSSAPAIGQFNTNQAFMRPVPVLGWEERPATRRQEHAQIMHQRLKTTRCHPALGLCLNALPRWEIGGQEPPRCSSADHLCATP